MHEIEFKSKGRLKQLNMAWEIRLKRMKRTLRGYGIRIDSDQIDAEAIKKSNESAHQPA